MSPKTGIGSTFIRCIWIKRPVPSVPTWRRITQGGCKMFFEDTSSIIGAALLIALCFLAVALGIALWRIVRAESDFDRVVALDLIGGVCLCCLVVFAIGFKQPVLLDSAFAL